MTQHTDYIYSRQLNKEAIYTAILLLLYQFHKSIKIWYLKLCKAVFFLWPVGHPYDCFPVDSIYGYIYIYNYIHIYMLVSLTQVCIVYVHVVKEFASFQGGLRQLMGAVHNRTCARTPQITRKKAACSFT